MLPCIRNVRECETLLTGRDQSHQCSQRSACNSDPAVSSSDCKLSSSWSSLHAHPTGLALRGPSDVDCVICSLATSDDTRIGFSCGPRLHLASLSCITTGTVCVLFSQSSSRLHSCVWVGCGSLGVHLHSRARHWHRNSAGTTYVVQGLVSQSFRPTSARCSPRSCSVALLYRRVRFVSWAISLSRLLRVARARLRLVTPAAVAASLTRCLVVSGHHSTISAFC